jgi:hypothetical protein
MRIVHERRAHRALALALVLLASAAADATPLTLYGAPDAGFALADVAAAIAAGEGEPAVVTLFGDGDGVFSLAWGEAVVSERGHSRRRPARGSGRWVLEVAPDAPPELLAAVAVVILGHDPEDPVRYRARKVGLEIDTESPWQLVRTAPGGPVYLAYALGGLVPGGSYELPIEYRVAQRLKRRAGEIVLPHYAVAYTSLPEPGTAGLALLGLGGVLFARRRR